MWRWGDGKWKGGKERRRETRTGRGVGERGGRRAGGRGGGGMLEEREGRKEGGEGRGRRRGTERMGREVESGWREEEMNARCGIRDRLICVG